MAALGLRWLCRRGRLNDDLYLRFAARAVPSHSDGLLPFRMAELGESKRNFRILVQHKLVHNPSPALLSAQSFGGQAEQAVDSPDATPTYHVYEDADSQAAASAFQSHLQNDFKAYLSDAAAVVSHAPLFVKQLVDLVKQKSQEKVEAVQKEPELNTKNIKKQKVKGLPATVASAGISFEKQVLSYLKTADVNVLEPILESIGMGSDRLQKLLQKLTEENVNVQSFLFVIRWIENLGFSRNIVGNIVEKEPRVLSYKFNEIEAGFSVLKELSIPLEEISRLFLRYPLILKTGVVDIIAALRADLSELPSRDIIIRKAICDKPVSVVEYKKDGADEVLQFLRSYGMTEDWLDRMLQRHFRLIFQDVGKCFVPNVKFLRDLGVPRPVISKVIKRSPGFLFLSPEKNLMPRLEYFKSLGLNEAEFAQMISRYPSLFSASLQNKIKPAIEELKTLGLTEKGLKKVVFFRPALFAHKLGGGVSALVSSLKESEYSDKYKTTAFIKLYARGMEHRKKCEECLMKYGFSCSEVKELFDKDPEALSYKEKTLESRLDFLTGTLGLPIKSVLSAPSYLSFGFKCNVFRRDKVLAYLKSKGLLTEDVTLEHVLSSSNADFYGEFIKPHYEDRDLVKIWCKNKQCISKAESLNFLKDVCTKKTETQVSL